MIHLMMVFRDENLYFTTARHENEYDRGYWQSQGYRVVFLKMDLQAMTAVLT